MIAHWTKISMLKARQTQNPAGPILVRLLSRHTCLRCGKPWTQNKTDCWVRHQPQRKIRWCCTDCAEAAQAEAEDPCPDKPVVGLPAGNNLLRFQVGVRAVG